MNTDVILNTLKYKTYFIHLDLKTNNLICTAYKYMENVKQEDTKNSIFKNVIYLGREIVNKSKNLKVLPDFEDVIVDSEFRGSAKPNIFENLDQLILTNYELRVFIANWFNDNGIPNFLYDYSLPPLIQEALEHTTLNKTLKSNNDNNFNNNVTINNLNFITAENATCLSDINSSLEYLFKVYEKYDFNIIPLLNVAILTYLIYSVRNILGNGRTSSTILKKYLKPFSYLYKRYKENNFKYSSDIGVIINRYFNKCLFYLISYIKNNIEVNNQREIDFSDNIKLPKDENDFEKYNFIFTKETYICNNPFVTAFEHLIQLNKISVPLSFKYQCKECGCELTRKQNLCYDCKIKYGHIFIDEKKSKYVDVIINELDDLQTDKNASTPQLEKLYNDRNYQRERYDRIKKN